MRLILPARVPDAPFYFIVPINRHQTEGRNLLVAVVRRYEFNLPNDLDPNN